MRRWTALAWLIPLVLVAVRWHNWQVLDPDRGYDSYSHSQVLHKIVLLHTLPLANDGFAGYHPPLYYLITGGVWQLIGAPPAELDKIGQLVSTLASFGMLVCAWGAGRRLLPGREWMVVVALAALPAELIVSAMLYDVPLAACWSALFLCVLLRAWPRTEPKLWEELTLGILAGAAWMTRPDGVALVMVLGLMLLWRWGQGPTRLRRDATVAFVAACACVGAVCGWYFCRNLAVFGRPLVFNGDYDTYQPWAGEPVSLPGFRTPSFYLGSDLQLFSDPDFPSQTPYFLGMNYASTWWAHLGYFSRSLDPRAGRWLLLLGLGPTTLAAIGLLWVLRRRERLLTWAPVLAMVVASCSAYTAMTLGLQSFPVIKPIYLYVAFVPLALLIGAGASAVIGRYPRLSGWLHASYATFALLVAWVFWCR